ncbi:hypothetical protein ACSTKO_24960, partial [Vibrio parahaemolyticus]
KTYPVDVARLIDDFCGYTFPFVWIFSNLIFWPISSSGALNAFFGLLLILTIVATALRIQWCYKHGKKGVGAPVRHAVRYAVWICRGQ